MGNAQDLDRPFDLAPMTEMDDVAHRAAAVGTLGGFRHGHLAEQGHQFVRSIEPCTIDMYLSIQRPLPSLFIAFRGAAVSNLRTLIINSILSRAAGGMLMGLPWEPSMAQGGRNNSRAGGFLVAFGIMAGVIVGGLMGQPSAGLLAGGSLGALIALAICIKDRRSAG